MTNSYEAKDYTPALENELAAVLARCKDSSNLTLAIGELLAANQSKAATATDAEIQTDVAQMDLERARGELIVMIASYRRLLRASAGLLMGNAEGHIWARKKVATEAADKSHAKHREGKKTARKLWDEWQTDRSLYKNKGDFDAYAAPAADVGVRAVRDWRLEWQQATENGSC